MSTGSPGEFDPMEASCGGTGDLCDCMVGPLQAIAANTARIAAALEDRLDESCNIGDKCIDEIIEKLYEKIKRPVKSCEECQSMLASGLGGTLAYAVECANACGTEAACECSMAHPECWGKPCPDCGAECCVCNQGICEPTECEDEIPRRYAAWCNPATGSPFVTVVGTSPPGQGWVQVGTTDTEQAAIDLATANCSQATLPPPPVVIKSPEWPAGTGPNCDFSIYTNPGSLGRVTPGKEGIHTIAAFAQASNNLAEIGLAGVTAGSILETITAGIRIFSGGPPVLAEQFIPRVAEIIGCNDPDFNNNITMLASMGHIHKAIGVDMSDYLWPQRYAANLMCRQRFLEPDKAITAYLGNSISQSDLLTIFGMHGYCEPAAQWYANAVRSKPVPLQLSMLRRRGLIGASDYQRSMREVGYLEPQVSENLHRLTEQLPTLTDILRFMVRDADDIDLVNKFGLDTEFDKKYREQLREWSEWQGIPENVARYAWRSHWSIPAPGQLFTFWRRLRDNKAFGGRDKLLADIKAALTQQDILPYWHDHFLAVSYAPLGRREIRQAYQIGALTYEKMQAAYVDLGLSDENAEAMAAFTRRWRDSGLWNHRTIRLWVSGTLTRAEAAERLKRDGIEHDSVEQALQDAEARFETSPAGKAFTRGTISRATLLQTLTDRGVSQRGAEAVADRLAYRITSSPALKDYEAGILDRGEAQVHAIEQGLNPAVVSGVLDAIDRELDRDRAVQCQRGIKKRYLDGELSGDEAIAELIRYGTTGERARRLQLNWGCEISSTGKAVSASSLCEWFDRGIISAPDFQNRLERMGYKPDDANRLVGDCMLKLTARQQQLAQRQIKLATQQEAAIEREQRRAAADIDRERRRIEAASNKAKATRLRRDKQLLSAIEKATDKLDIPLADMAPFMREQQRRITDRYVLTPDQSLQVLLKGVEEWQGDSLASLPEIFDRLAEALVTSAHAQETNGSISSAS